MLLAVASLRANGASANNEANEESAWSAVEALDASKPPHAPASREEARSMALAILSKKEEVLRMFLAQYPKSPRAVEARIRLAHLMLTQSDFSGQPARAEMATTMINDALATANETTRPDFLFAKITLAMRRIAMPTEKDRESLTTQALAFQKQYPTDRRVAGLLTEMATLYDDQPKRKESLLNEALRASRSEEMSTRIHDDLKRLAMLGQPVIIQGKGSKGENIDTNRLHGKVVVVYFFAGFSAPSVAGLEVLQQLRSTFSRGQVEIVGVNLDPSLEVVRAIAEPRQIDWPILWDGKGWHSPLIRQLAINALPTLWILDKKGTLRTLNAKDDCEPLIRALLK